MQLSFKRISFSIFLLFAALLGYWLIRFYVFQPLDFDDFVEQLYWKNADQHPETYSLLAPPTPIDPLLLPYTADIGGLHHAMSAPLSPQNRLLQLELLGEDLAAYQFDKLNPDQQLIYTHIVRHYELQKSATQYDCIPYAFNSHDGQPWEIMNVLVFVHPVFEPDQADAYLSRLRRIPNYIKIGINQSLQLADSSLLPPAVVLTAAIERLNAWLQLSPTQNPLYTSFARKLAAADPTAINEGLQVTYLIKAEQTITKQVYPALQLLDQHLQQLAAKAPAVPGIWQYPNGDTAYQLLLKQYAGEVINPDQAFQWGTEQVRTAHEALVALESPAPSALAYPAFREKVHATLADFSDRGVGLFEVLPEANLLLHEISDTLWPAGSLYVPAGKDRQRTAVMYLSGKGAPEVSAYEKGIPGRHLLSSILANQQNMPLISWTIPQPAYWEGWEGYAQALATEYGFFQTPESQAAAIRQTLKTGAALVIDCGIHAQQWSLTQASAYLDRVLVGTSESEKEMLLQAVLDRPGYSIARIAGKRKFLALRERSQTELGPAFQIREFHQALMEQGPLSPDLLEKSIDLYIRKQKM